MTRLLLVCLMLFACLPACADYLVFTDNFDDGNWTVSPRWEEYPAGSVTVSSEQSTSGQYSLKVASNNERGAIRATSGLGSTSQEYSCTFNLYVQSLGDEAIPWCLQSPSGGIAAIIFILPGGTVQLFVVDSTTTFHGKTSNVPYPLTYGQWHSFRLTYDGSTTNLYLDGHQTPDASVTQTYLYMPSQICVGHFSMAHTSTFYVDDLSIFADISPAKVYVQMCSDTSVTGLNTGSHYNAFPPADPTYVSPTAQAAQVMAESYRDALRDSMGNTIKFTWYMLCGSMYSYGTTTGPLLSFELMQDYHGSEVVRWGDEMAYHYHTWLWYDMDGDGLDAWDPAPDFSYCVDDYEFTVAHLVLDRGFYPSSFRSGWHYMDNIFQNYLDDWIPYRFENACGQVEWNRSPTEWVPYHPDPDDYQVPGNMRGWESRCMYMKSITSSVVGGLFASAQAGTPQLLTAWSHLQETDFPTQAQDVHALLTAAHETFPLVEFEYLTGRSSMLKWRGGTDVTPPVVSYSTSDNNGIRTADFSTDEAIYQVQPFAARKSADGTYSRMDCTQLGPNQWSVQYDINDTVSMAVAVTDWFGNATVRFLPVQFIISDVDTTVGSDSLEIRWNTNNPADTSIEYGLAYSGGTMSVHQTQRVLAHHVTLDGLIPGRVYKLKIRAENEAGQHAESPNIYVLTKLSDEIIVDNADPGFSIFGSWNTGTSSGDRYGVDYRWTSASLTGTSHADWTAQVQKTDLYGVYAWWPQGGNRSNQARYSVLHDGNEYPVVVNQQANGGQWNLLGTYDFDAGDTISVRLSNNAPSGYVVIADAIKIEPAYIPVSSAGMARLVPDGSRIKIPNTAVTAVFGSEFYIEATDRSAGLKVAGTGVSPGELVEVSGEVSTSSGERLMINPSVRKLPGVNYLDPLRMATRDISLSGDSRFVTAGLLMTVTGNVRSTGTGYFYVDDGSLTEDGTGHIGLRVDASCLSSLPDTTDHAVLTGVLGAITQDGKTIPVLRPRDADDVLLY